MNPDPFKWFIGPKNWGEARIDGELTTCLLDNGAQLNFMTPTYVLKRGLNMMSLDHLTQEVGGTLPPIQGIGGIMVEPTGFVIVNVQVPCVKGYNEDQIAIVLDDPSMKECPVILGTPTLYRVMQVIKQSEISKLAIPWAASQLCWLMKDWSACMGHIPVSDATNKVVTAASVDEVVYAGNLIKVLPFGHKVVHGRTGLILQGCKIHVMTHGLEKKSPKLTLGLEILSSYATLTMGSCKVAVVIQNITNDWLEIIKGTLIARMESANQTPPCIYGGNS